MLEYVATDKYIVHTTFRLPHIECYVIVDNILYEETIDGRLLCIGPVESMSDNLSDLPNRDMYINI